MVRKAWRETHNQTRDKSQAKEGPPSEERYESSTLITTEIKDEKRMATAPVVLDGSCVRMIGHEDGSAVFG